MQLENRETGESCSVLVKTGTVLVATANVVALGVMIWLLAWELAGSDLLLHTHYTGFVIIFVVLLVGPVQVLLLLPLSLHLWSLTKDTAFRNWGRCCLWVALSGVLAALAVFLILWFRLDRMPAD